MKQATSYPGIIASRNLRFGFTWGWCLCIWVLLQFVACTSPNKEVVGSGENNDSSLIVDEFRSRFENGQYLCVISYSSECPIAKTYIKTIRSLYQRYGKSITFCLLDPGVGGKLITGMEQCVFRDPQLFICKRYGIRVYPQVVLANCLTRKVIYSGKIDDRAVSLGVVKKEASNLYLEQALSQLMKHNRVDVKSNEAVGCFVGDVGLKQ